MVTSEVTLPDRIDSDIDRLVEQDDFLNREQAIEELLSLGVSSHNAAGESEEELVDDVFTQAVDDQQDPANHQDDQL
ncbi:ribbon-helix-helix domain-containing protein [Haladaptatus halobius]|jgi:Arc/MetJ-type ribon-helix-helix transcriptional regulator|uniref:ribbon-helix-helix domain-containing protein n=1 Tax=Haladaptatus halobius TaxID=2884875 RepID=UPI001D0A7D6A|nr:ribbon-helix-helix domain-containing protein [Haladaptatus halobius]